MRKSISILAVILAAAPAFADKKLDDAVAKAESLAEKGKPEEGIKAVQKVAEQSNSAEAYIALGRLQNRLASPEEAQTSLAKASSCRLGHARGEGGSAGGALGPGSPARHGARRADPRGRGGQGRARERERPGRAGARPGPRQGRRHRARHRRQGRAGGAQQRARPLARGEALLASSRAKEAEAEFPQGLEVDPKLHLARTKLAWALLRAGDAAGAEAEAKKASDADQKIRRGVRRARPRDPGARSQALG
jgi:tetratricopeptide (TPR) repeat protein